MRFLSWERNECTDEDKRRYTGKDFQTWAAKVKDLFPEDDFVTGTEEVAVLKILDCKWVDMV